MREEEEEREKNPKRNNRGKNKEKMEESGNSRISAKWSAVPCAPPVIVDGPITYGTLKAYLRPPRP